jgi:hypothetical protein
MPPKERCRSLRLAVRLAALIPTALLAGCNSAGQSGYGEYFKILRQAWGTQFGDGGITRNEAAAIPYASMGYRIDDERERITVLATDVGGEQLWTAADHIVLVTRDGRLQRSVGLTHDLGGTTFSTGSLPGPARAIKAPFESTRQRDFPDLGLYGVAIHCRAATSGRQSVSILGNTIATIRVDEKCRASTYEWSYTDSFWVDPESGVSWKSIQHIHPKGETIQTEIFRPPS